MADSAALQSLSVAFQRKGIVAGTGYALPAQVQTLVDSLKTNISQVVHTSTKTAILPSSPGSGSTRELFSGIQLWKERSLHQTLQIIDETAERATTSASILQEGHIKTIELHERAAKEISGLVNSLLDRTVIVLNRQLDAFALQLAEILDDLIRPELGDQLEHERMLVRRLVEQKQALDREKDELQHSHAALSARLDLIENTPEGGGDAILCNKLRIRIRELVDSDKDLRGRIESLTLERDKAKWEIAQVQRQLEEMRQTLTFTCAMHEKETKQLLAAAQMNYDQVCRVFQATSSTVQLDSAVKYDALSGRTIIHPSPRVAPRTTRPPSSPIKTRLASMSKTEPPCSPNQKTRQLTASSSCRSRTSQSQLNTTTAQLRSPSGEVARPFYLAIQLAQTTALPPNGNL